MDKLREGVIYNAIGKYSNVIITFLVQMILSRILSPSEFGTLAVVNIFLVFFQLISDFGIGPAIIQIKNITKKEVNHIFSFSVYLSIVLAFLFSLLSQPISVFYNNSMLISVVPVMALVLLFNSLSMVPQNVLLRDKQFKILNVSQVLGSLTNGIVSIILALNGFSYYSLTFGNITRALVQWLIYMYYTELNFKFRFSMSPLKKIARFASNQFGFNLINFFSRNIDSILIGRYFNTEQLAYYDKAYQLSLYPNTIFTSVITTTIQPIYSDFQDDLNKIKDGYLKISQVLANFGIPLSVFLFFSSEDLILIIFGEQWGASVLTFKILSISIWIQILLSSTGSFFQSVNRTDLLLLSGILSALLNVIFIIIGILMGSINWVAAMLVISFSINFIQTNFLLLNVALKGSILELFRILFRPTIIGLITLFFFLLFGKKDYSSPIVFLFKVGLFLFSLIIGLLITNQFNNMRHIFKK